MMEKTNELTEKQVKEYCRKRDLMIVSADMVHRLQLVGQKFATNQLTKETKNFLEAKNEKLTCRNIILSANVQNLEAEAGSLRFRYENMKKLLNQFIATGLIPGYFDIYNQLCQTKGELKNARKETATANKRYKQLKKEFDRYKSQMTKVIIPKCEDCYWSFFYGEQLCCSAHDEQECSAVGGPCKGFKPKEKDNGADL